MIYDVEWNNKAKEHLGSFDGNEILIPEIQDCEVRSDEDIKFWRRFGLKELPLYAKDKNSLIYQDIHAGDVRSVEVARVKMILIIIRTLLASSAPLFPRNPFSFRKVSPSSAFPFGARCRSSPRRACRAL